MKTNKIKNVYTHTHTRSSSVLYNLLLYTVRVCTRAIIVITITIIISRTRVKRVVDDVSRTLLCINYIGSLTNCVRARARQCQNWTGRGALLRLGGRHHRVVVAGPAWRSPLRLTRERKKKKMIETDATRRRRRRRRSSRGRDENPAGPVLRKPRDSRTDGFAILTTLLRSAARTAADSTERIIIIIICSIRIFYYYYFARRAITTTIYNNITHETD